MKKIILGVVLSLISTHAWANDTTAQGAWVKVDASGNAIGGAIVCSSDVCGDSNSPYAKATLNAGEQYVLQAKADPVTNNVAGIGNNNPNTQVQVNIPTQEWTITRTHTVTPEVPVIINNQEVISYTVQTKEKFTADTAPWVAPKEPAINVISDTVTVVTDTTTAVIDTVTITAKTVKAKKTKTKTKKKAAIK
jgi:hypothetical protein